MTRCQYQLVEVADLVEASEVMGGHLYAVFMTLCHS